MQTALVLGSGGQIGSAITVHLSRRGWRVFAAKRSKRPFPQSVASSGASLIEAGDRSLVSLIGEAGGRVDTLVDPLAFDADDAQRIVAQSGRLGSLVVLSSSSVYADAEGRSIDEAKQAGFPDFGGPMSEDQPTVEAGPGTYSTRKMAMEQVLLAGQVPTLLLRPCAIHGAYGRHPREWWFIKRGLDRRPAIPLAFDGLSRFGTTSADAIASLTEIWLRQPRTTILNVADRDAPNVSEIAQTISEKTGLALPITPFSGPPLENGVGSSPWSIEKPFTLDCSKAEALGWVRGSYAETIRPTCRWIIDTAKTEDWRSAFPIFTQYGDDPFDYAAEDAFLKAR